MSLHRTIISEPIEVLARGLRTVFLHVVGISAIYRVGKDRSPTEILRGQFAKKRLRKFHNGQRGNGPKSSERF